jgi:uncharacterized membrane protein YqjE
VATSPPAPGADGLVAQLRRFFAAAAHYLSLRLRLAKLEGKEAAAHALKLVVLAVGALVFVGFGWLFFCLAMVAWIAKAFSTDGLLWASLIVAAAHFALAGLLVLALKASRHFVPFPLTTEELKKDQAWLDQQTPKNTP